MTVKEFIEKHPDATMNMMTPDGYVTLTPLTAADLIQGKSIDAHPGANEHWAKKTQKNCFHRKLTNAECIPKFQTASL